jgi:hypothetical protein
MVRLANTPKKIKPQKASIIVGKDDRLLVMTQRGGKLKAHMLRAAEGAKRQKVLARNIKEAYLVIESREDLMFVKEEYKFHQDTLKRLEASYRSAVREEVKSFFTTLEASRVFRPQRVNIKWEKS